MLPIFHCLGCKERVDVVGFLQECFSLCFVPFFPRLLHQCVEVLQVFHHGKPVLVFSAVLVEFAHLHTDRCEPPNLCPFHMLQHWVVFSSRSQVSELKVLQPLASSSQTLTMSLLKLFRLASPVSTLKEGLSSPLTKKQGPNILKNKALCAFKKI